MPPNRHTPQYRSPFAGPNLHSPTPTASSQIPATPNHDNKQTPQPKRYKRLIQLARWVACGLLVIAVAAAAVYLSLHSGQSLNKAYQSGFEGVTLPRPVSVVAIGDIACSPQDPNFNNTAGTTTACRMRAVADLIATLRPDALLMLGDLQYQAGDIDSFNASFDKVWGKQKIRIRAAPGNHEYGTEQAAGYFEYFNGQEKSGLAGDTGKGYYSFNMGTWHLIALNSNCEFVACAEGSEQYEWLKKDLADHNNKCTLAFWHHPVFTSGKYKDNAAERTRGLPFWRLLESAKAEVVLNGHDHNYQRYIPQNDQGAAISDGPVEFVVGTGGSSLYAFNKPLLPTMANGQDGKFGALRLQLVKNGYSWQYADETNHTLDEGSASCH